MGFISSTAIGLRTVLVTEQALTLCQVTEVSSWYSDEVCKNIVETKLHSYILDYVNDDKLTVNSLTQSTGSQTRRQFVERLLAILLNVVVNLASRSDSNTPVDQDDRDVVKILHKLRDFRQLPVTSLTHSTVAYISSSSSSSCIVVVRSN